MNPLSPTKRSWTFWTYSASVFASLARATTAGTLASPIRLRSRRSTSPNETEVSTSTRMPWNGLVVTSGAPAIFSLSFTYRLCAKRIEKDEIASPCRNEMVRAVTAETIAHAAELARPPRHRSSEVQYAWGRQLGPAQNRGYAYLSLPALETGSWRRRCWRSQWATL